MFQRNLAAALVACDNPNNEARNCTDNKEFMECLKNFTETDMDNYAVYYGAVISYCAYVRSKDEPYAISTTVVGLMSGFSEVKQISDSFFAENPVARMVASQFIPISNSEEDFRKGQIPMYFLLFILLFLCRIWLNWSCQCFARHLLYCLAAECFVAYCYNSAIGGGLVSLFTSSLFHSIPVSLLFY